jgi:hypothetical protein
LKDQTITAKDILAWLAVFTFIFPVIPLLGIGLYDHINAQSSNSHAQNISPAISTAPVKVTYTTANFIADLNTARASTGAPNLTDNLTMDDSAQDKLNDMVTGNYFAVTNPITGKAGYSYINDRYNGYCASVGEVIYQGDVESKSTLDTILNSDKRATLLDTNYDKVGIAGDSTHTILHFCESRIAAPAEPTGSGAICADGWRSYSTGRGTCSHHGGVSEWL